MKCRWHSLRLPGLTQPFQKEGTLLKDHSAAILRAHPSLNGPSQFALLPTASASLKEKPNSGKWQSKTECSADTLDHVLPTSFPTCKRRSISILPLADSDSRSVSVPFKKAKLMHSQAPRVSTPVQLDTEPPLWPATRCFRQGTQSRVLLGQIHDFPLWQKGLEGDKPSTTAHFVYWPIKSAPRNLPEKTLVNYCAESLGAESQEQSESPMSCISFPCSTWYLNCPSVPTPSWAPTNLRPRCTEPTDAMNRERNAQLCHQVYLKQLLGLHCQILRQSVGVRELL